VHPQIRKIKNTSHETIAGVSELMRDYTFSSSKFKSFDTS
jgi:hypothetical protein